MEMNELEEMHQRLIELEASEVEPRRAEEESRKHRDSLAELVAEHTAELEKVNAVLQTEIAQSIQAQ